MDIAELQDEVVRILRRMTLEENREVAEHLEIGDLGVELTKREVLRRIQDVFDAAEDEAAKDLLLRGLPIPDAQRADYQRLLDPPQEHVAPVNDGVQVVPGANVNVAGGEAVGDQVVPLNNDGVPLQQGNGPQQQQQPQQNIGGVQQMVGALNLGGLQQNLHQNLPGNRTECCYC